MAQEPVVDEHAVDPVVLWTLSRPGHVAVCAVIVDANASTIQLLCNGSVLTEHTFASFDDALAAAAEDRHKLLTLGWEED